MQTMINEIPIFTNLMHIIDQIYVKLPHNYFILKMMWFHCGKSPQFYLDLMVEAEFQSHN